MKRKFLSVLLCLCMVLTMVPAAFAEELEVPDFDVWQEDDPSVPMDVPNVLADENTFTDSTTTLSSGEYKLDNDVQLTGTLTIQSDATVTIDLNGHTITGPTSAITITVPKGASLTINDNAGNGKITNGTPSSSNSRKYVINNAGTLVINGGTIEGTGSSNGQDYGRTTINNSGEGANLTVNGGTISSDWRIAIKNDDVGNPTLTIKGGTIQSVADPMEQAVQNWATCKIEGGTIDGKVITWEYSSAAGNTTITGGTIKRDVMIATYQGQAPSTRAPSVSISGNTVVEGTVGFLNAGDAAGKVGNATGEITVTGQNVTIGGVSNGATAGKVTVDGATITGNVTAKPSTGSETTTGTVEIKNSTIQGTVDASINKENVTDCTDAAGDPIGQKYTVNVSGSGVNATVDKPNAEKGDEVTITLANGESIWGFDIVVKDADGNAIAVNDGKFTMPAGAVYVTVTKRELVGGMITVTTAAELTTALNSAEVTTIKLGADITASSSFVVSESNARAGLTLDLNGHKLNSTGSPTIHIKGTADKSGELTIIDSVGGGEINNTNTKATNLKTDNYGKLTLGKEDGTCANFTISMADNGSDAISALKVDELGTLVIYGGTVKGPNTPQSNKRSIQSFGTTTINGGTFEGEVQVWTWQENGNTYDSTMTIKGGTFKDTVAICNVATANDSYPFTGTLDIQGGTFTNESGDGDGYRIGIQIPEGRENDTSITAEIKVTSGVTFPAAINAKYLSGDMNYEAKTSDGKYSYHRTQAEAEKAAGTDGEVKVVTSDGVVELPDELGCTYTEVEGTPIGDGNDDHVYYEDSMFGGKLTLSGLTEGTKYVVQLAKAGSYNAENCTIVVFTAEDETHAVEVLKSAQGYTVSLYMFTDNDGTDIRSIVPTNLSKTTIAASAG